MAETLELQEAGFPFGIDENGLRKFEGALEVVAQGFMRLTASLLQTEQVVGLLADRLVQLAGAAALAPSAPAGGTAPAEAREKPEPKSVEKIQKNIQTLRDLAQVNGMEAVANDAQSVMESVRDIGRVIDNMVLQVSGVVFEKIKGPLEEFAQWFETHGPLIGKRLSEVAGAALDMALVMAPVLGWVGSLFLDLDAATGGLSTKVLVAITAFRMLGGPELINGLVALANAIGMVNAASNGLGNIGGFFPAGGLPGRAGLAGLAAGVGLEIARGLGVPDTDVQVGQQAVRDGEWFKAASYLPAGDFFGAVWDHWFGDDPPQSAQGGAGAAISPAGIGTNPPAGDQVSGAAATGADGASAIDAGLAALAAEPARLTSAQMLDNADRAAFAAGQPFRALASNQSQAREGSAAPYTGSASVRLPAFGEPMLPMIAAPWDGYRSGAPDALELSLNVASPQVNLTATTNIHVEGSADPMATAVAVAGQQDRVFADLTRNTQGAYL